MKKSYTPLHVHSEYSLLDGLSKCEDIVERANEIGSSACAITDHGSCSGAVDFSGKAKDGNIKPILGSEFYVNRTIEIVEQDRRPSDHQVILAKNERGWKDILRLTSTANLKSNFYYKPRINLSHIEEVAASGNLVSFSGHLGSILANYICEGDQLHPDHMNRGIFMANKLQSIFGKGNFFIEIQLIDSKINTFAGTVAGVLREISKKTGIPCVATPDAHYCRKDDAEDQRVLLCTQFKKTLPEVYRELKEGIASRSLITFFNSDNYHIPTYEEMIAFHTEEELENTNIIAEMCDKYSIAKPPFPPEFICPKGMNPNDYLRYLCQNGWKDKMSGAIKAGTKEFKEYGDRVNYELDTFTSINLSSYFLIVADIINFVQSQGYLTGPGRGSAAGCMVSYLLGITKINPIPYNLVFERFYNAGRNAPGKISWPDIDFDVPKEARPKVIEYIRNKYGKDNTAQIITFQTMKGRSALKRVMAARGNISFDEQNAITKYIMDEAKVADELQDIEEEYGFSSTILWALEHDADKLKDWCYINDEGKLEGRFSKIFEQAIRLEHTKIGSGKHAAGVVISASPISESCPMVLDKEEENMLAGFEGPGCEEVGLLKLDCLGIRSLDKIMDISDIVKGVKNGKY